MGQLRIGSRGSQLALWQANHIASLLQGQGHDVSIKVIKTTGDKITDVPLAKVGTKGMFTKEIEEAMTAGQIDLAVHSLKDLPTELPSGFTLAAIPERDDARDAFVSINYSRVEDLPTAARIGTSSLRRQAQLHAMRPDLNIVPLRGNVDTRLRKLENKEFDAIILAAAGLTRLGLHDRVLHCFEPQEMCPAAGQGALAIETRTDDRKSAEAVSFIDHGPTRSAVECERAVLSVLGGGCQVPIGAFADSRASGIRLYAVVASPDGRSIIRQEREGLDPKELGTEVGQALLAQGAKRILDLVYRSHVTVPQQP